jgi:hypothetical protein
MQNSPPRIKFFRIQTSPWAVLARSCVNIFEYMKVMCTRKCLLRMAITEQYACSLAYQSTSVQVHYFFRRQTNFLFKEWVYWFFFKRCKTIFDGFLGRWLWYPLDGVMWIPTTQRLMEIGTLILGKWVVCRFTCEQPSPATIFGSRATRATLGVMLCGSNPVLKQARPV